VSIAGRNADGARSTAASSASTSGTGASAGWNTFSQNRPNRPVASSKTMFHIEGTNPMNLCIYGMFAFLTIANDLLDFGKEGSTIGGQALLFLAVIILGGVVLVLDKRREKTRDAERDALGAQFHGLLNHHESAVESARTERVKFQDELLTVVKQNTEANIALRTLIDERIKR
jgi:hypothetical protein